MTQRIPLLTAHPGVRKISFTGSTPTGRQVLRSAAGDLKRVKLELGSNDPPVVLPGADLDAVAGPILDAAFMNNGQTCAAIKRVYGHASQHDAIVRRLAERADAAVVGEGTRPGVTLGPLQNKGQYALVKELLADALSRRAQRAFRRRPAIGCRLRTGRARPARVHAAEGAGLT